MFGAGGEGDKEYDWNTIYKDMELNLRGSRFRTNRKLTLTSRIKTLIDVEV